MPDPTKPDASIDDVFRHVQNRIANDAQDRNVPVRDLAAALRDLAEAHALLTTPAPEADPKEP